MQLPRQLVPLLVVAASGTLDPPPFCDALKHNFYTKNDHRTLIGPLGFPFGFLKTGHYNLTVFDFQLLAPEGLHDHTGPDRRLAAADDNAASNPGAAAPQPLSDAIKGVGFLLKPFRDEAAFNKYMSWVKANSSRCIFQRYLDRTDDGDLLRDDDIVSLDDHVGEGDVDGGIGGDDDTTRGRRGRKQRRLRVLDDVEDAAQTEGFGEFTGSKDDGHFLDMMPRSRWAPHRPSAAYNFRTGDEGFYFLMYQVCYKGDASKEKNELLDIHSQFELDFHFSNLDVFNNESYLSAGEMALPHLFFWFSLLYAICLYLWISNIRLIKEGKPGHFDSGMPPQGAAPPTPLGRGVQAPTVTIYPIHYLMAFLLTLKTMTLFAESIRYHYLRVTGNAVFWSAVYYTFTFLKGITLFTVILLIGSGWSFVKPFLSDREKNMILAILVLQVVNNIAIVVLTQETEGENAFGMWTAILHFVDILCCCAVLLPILWQVNQLEKNMEQNQHHDEEDADAQGANGGVERATLYDVDEFDDEHIPEDELENVPINGSSSSRLSQPARPPDERLAAKLKLFRSFYLLVIAYIYITRIVVYLFASMLSYRHTWVRFFVVEAVTLIFYCTVGMLFRPMNENPYLHVRRRPDAGQAVDGKGRAAQVEMRKIDAKSKAVMD